MFKCTVMSLMMFSEFWTTTHHDPVGRSAVFEKERAFGELSTGTYFNSSRARLVHCGHVFGRREFDGLAWIRRWLARSIFREILTTTFLLTSLMIPDSRYGGMSNDEYRIT